MDITKVLGTIKGKVLDATHYELLANAYEVQQQNIIQLKENNASIKESNELLREKLRHSDEKINILQERISELEPLAMLPSNDVKKSLTDDHMKILVFLSTTGDRDVYKRTLSSQINTSDEKTQYYLDGLVEQKLVYAHFSLSYPTSYSLTKEGRAFLVEKNLL